MGKKVMKGMSVALVCSLVVGIAVPTSAAKKIQLSEKKVVLEVGAQKKLTVKNAGKKAKWSVKSGKKYISLSQKTKKSVVVKAKKEGKAVVLATVGKKKLTCRVTVKKASKEAVTQTPSVAPTQSAAPSVVPTATATPTIAPTATPTVVPTATPTVEPTPTATPTAKPSTTPAPTMTPEFESSEFKYEGLDEAWIQENIDPSKPMVAMTFDDGPGGYGEFVDYGMQIQQALKDAGAHATFFYIGSHIEKSDECKNEVKQAYEWGFEVANHSYDTSELSSASVTAIKDKISKTDALLKEITGYSNFLFRAPGVSYSDKMYAVIQAPFIDVSNWSNDWQGSVTKDQIVKNVKMAKDGDIINMHSVHEKTAQAVPEILAYFKAQGIQVVSVSELFHIRGQKLMTGVQYSKCPPAAE